MEEPKTFDAYEVIGVITPGIVVTLLLATEEPKFRALLGDDGLSVGDLGLFLMVAFVLGHLLQALGNLVELVVWPFGGLPSNWMRSAKQRIVTEAQRDSFQARVAEMEGEANSLNAFDRVQWQAITTRAYARVRASGRSFRIDIANRTYGLFRGLTSGLAICLAWYLYAHADQNEVIGLLLVLLTAAVWRMRRAGVHYARALVLEFIDLPTGQLPPPKSDLRSVD